MRADGSPPPDADEVVLVDAHDRAIGSMAKLPAHREGRLHRAVSVFLFDAAGRLLLQRRAAGKYHSAGRWANSCCGHPRPGEPPAEAARRRLREEMGIDCPLEFAGVLTYRAHVAEDLVEHELDHLFVGRFDGLPHPDPREVSEWRWTSLADLRRDLGRRPNDHVVWLRPALAVLREDTSRPRRDADASTAADSETRPRST